MHFYRAVVMDSFTIEQVATASFNRIQTKILVLLQILYQNKHMLRRMGGCNFRNIVPFIINVKTED